MADLPASGRGTIPDAGGGSQRGQWPNFFIVGAPKAGTTTLWAWLRQHPDVFLAEAKEIRFFSTIQPWPWFDNGEPVAGHDDPDAYLDHFRDAGDASVVGEATATYLADPGTPARIAKRVPDARVLIVVRDPIDRAFSDYLMDRRNGVQSRQFLECVIDELGRGVQAPAREYVWPGRYATHVKAYLDALGAGQVHVAEFAQLREDPRGFLRDVFEFLGVDPDAADTIDVGTALNTYRGPRGPFSELLLRSRWFASARRSPLPTAVASFVRRRVLQTTKRKPRIRRQTRWILAEQFEPEVAELERILGRPMPSLRASWPDEFKHGDGSAGRAD